MRPRLRPGTAMTRASSGERRPASPRLRRCELALSYRHTRAAQGTIHGIAHDDILLAGGTTQRVLRTWRVDPAQRHGGTRTELGVLAPPEQALSVQHRVERRDAVVPAQCAIR